MRISNFQEIIYEPKSIMNVQRIVHLITTIERGGAETQLLILCKEQIKMKMHVEIIYLKGKPELKSDFIEAGVLVNELIANKKLYYQVFYLKKFYNNSKILLHAHLPKAEVVAFMSLSKNKFVVTRHNHENFWPGVPHHLSTILSRIVISKASNIIVISSSLAEFLKGNKEIPRTMTPLVIHYAYDRARKTNNPNQNQQRKIANDKNNFMRIGIISRIVPSKNFETLFMALSLVLSKYHQVQLYIVGSGFLKANLIKTGQQLGIIEKIHWLGKIDFVPQFLDSLDLFVFPSKKEGFGLVLLEAMQSGVPTLAANNTAIAEVLGETYAGLFETENYYQLSEKIMKVLEDKNFAQKLSNELNSRLVEFNPVNMAHKILKVYQASGIGR